MQPRTGIMEPEDLRDTWDSDESMKNAFRVTEIDTNR
jgi:hypothetical protein